MPAENAPISFIKKATDYANNVKAFIEETYSNVKENYLVPAKNSPLESLNETKDAIGNFLVSSKDSIVAGLSSIAFLAVLPTIVKSFRDNVNTAFSDITKPMENYVNNLKAIYNKEHKDVGYLAKFKAVGSETFQMIENVSKAVLSGISSIFSNIVTNVKSLFKADAKTKEANHVQERVQEVRTNVAQEAQNLQNNVQGSWRKFLQNQAQKLLGRSDR